MTTQPFTLIFIHVPKTGGQTLQAVLKRQFPKHTWAGYEYRNMSEEKKRTIRLIRGHVPYGMHEFVPSDVEYHYLTMLREPVSRFVSNFNYWKQEGRFSQSYSLEDYARYGAEEIGNNNLQTRYIAGLMKPEKPRPGQPRTYDPLPENALEMAKTALTRDFSIVGITERFNDSMIVIKHMFSFSRVVYARRNTTRIHTKIDIDSTGLRTVIERNNALDVELYALANELLTQQIEQLNGVDITREREIFEKQTQRYQRYWNMGKSVYDRLPRHIKTVVRAVRAYDAT